MASDDRWSLGPEEPKVQKVDLSCSCGKPIGHTVITGPRAGALALQDNVMVRTT